MLALDTEFIRTDTFYPIAALVQVSDGKNCFLIDPQLIKQLEPLKQLLENKNIVKVLHSCSEDLEVFDCLLGVLPQPLFDTQLGAAMDGYGYSLGYQRLTQAMLQIELAKGETRSNWLQRPLSSSQIHYAALDVAYLPCLYYRLRDSLSSKGRLNWLQEDCQVMLDRFSKPDNFDQYYQKVKSAWKLNRAELAILREITTWREHCAREHNVPRSRVLTDRSCYEISRMNPQRLRDLANVDGLMPKTIRTYGEKLLQLIEYAQSLQQHQWPESLPRPLPAQTGALLKKLKNHVNECADQLQIAAELLVKKRDYEAVLRSGIGGGQYQLPESLKGWRKAVVGDQLLDYLTGVQQQ